MSLFSGLRRASRPSDAPTPCIAPDINLHFLPDGEVRTCSRSTLALGRWPDQSIREIWDGRWRSEVRRRLAADDFSAGCQACGHEFRSELRDGSIAAAFDVAPGGPRTRAEGAPGWPLRFDFRLSNVCNLQCVQCNGDYSSSIRRHREHRPALVSPYDDRFVDQVEEFLPRLEGAQFAGGEPFMVPINYAIWERIAEVAPDLDCAIITNGTRWTPKVEAALDAIRAHVIVSLDSLDPVLGADIRVGSDVDVVLANLDRFCSYADQRGTTVCLNACLLRDNVGGLVDLAVHAEQRGVRLNVVPVRDPAERSLATAPLEVVQEAAAGLRRDVDAVAGRLELNGAILELTAARLERWAEQAAGGGDRGAVVMLRPRRGGADERRTARALEAAVPGAVAASASLPPGRVGGCDSSLGPLPGATLGAVLAAVGATGPDGDPLGDVADHLVVEFDDDRYVADVRFARWQGRVALLGHRSRDGAAGLRVLWALVATEDGAQEATPVASPSTAAR